MLNTRSIGSRRTIGVEPSQPASLGAQSAPPKPVVVGLYGVPKTFLLSKLRQELEKEGFAFYDGSKVIAELVPGGLDAFDNLGQAEKTKWRERAIARIQQECANNGKSAVVAGHYMFWPEDEEAGQMVATKKDLDVYTHILYLTVPASVVAWQRQEDTNRRRPTVSESHIHKWQNDEMIQLRDLCYNHGILFSYLHTALISDHKFIMKKAATLLRDFRANTEARNSSLANSKLDEVVAAFPGPLEKVLVMDGDKTLAAEDTGALFWQSEHRECPLTKIFSSSLAYSYTAFRQATLLYDEKYNDEEFDKLCDAIATGVHIYPEIRALLQQSSNHTHVRAVVVTSGLRRVWAKVLEREGLADSVKVIGGGRIADGFVVTPELKGALVTRLQDVHKLYVWGFGDSPLDLEMLKKADQAIFVVGDEQTRSRSMDAALQDAITTGGLRARQALLPSNVLARLDTTTLPLVRLTDKDFIDSVFSQRRVFHATNKAAAKLLMTPMRDARNNGPRLREEHRRVGSYLATEVLTDTVGLEEYSIPHVHGHTSTGYRLLHEEQTLVVALMRGGEPMAFGVNDVFPQAKFLHAKNPEDITERHMEGIRNIFLVDSVVNTGKSVLQFVEYIRRVNAATRIVVVAGVVQADAVSAGSVSLILARDANLFIVTLRLSDNKYTGRGGTDTGHRLFNTTNLD